MKKESILLVVIALVIGILVGILATKGGKDREVAQGGAPAAPAVNYQERIQVLEQLVGREPGNRNAWVQLGHLYFDSNQPPKAIEAYDKALALDPNDPDVLTDQGVMFRELGWFDRAIDNFTKANKIKPGHPQSLFNLGVVYRYDLNDFPRAIETWSKFLELNPNSPGAEKIRSEVEFMKNHPNLPAEGGAPSGAGPR